MQNHTWRERDDEGLTFFRATHHGGRWTLSSQRKGEDWTKHDPIPEELLEKLRECVFNKYQRGRCSWKLVSGVDKLLGRESVDPNQG